MQWLDSGYGAFGGYTISEWVAPNTAQDTASFISFPSFFCSASFVPCPQTSSSSRLLLPPNDFFPPREGAYGEAEVRKRRRERRMMFGGRKRRRRCGRKRRLGGRGKRSLGGEGAGLTHDNGTRLSLLSIFAWSRMGMYAGTLEA